MANQERGELGVNVGGSTYTLRPTFDSLCELETLVDQPIDQILAGVQQGRVSGLRAVVWCLLQDAHAAQIRTLKDASRWIESAGGVEAALKLVSQVMGLNVEEPDASGAEAPPADPPSAQGDGTGAGSLSTPAASV